MTSTDNSNAQRPTVTLSNLGLTNSQLPEDFVPRYLAMDESGYWYLFDALPVFEYDEWTVAKGKWYEVGFIEAGSRADVPGFVQDAKPESSLMEIV